MSCGSPHNFLDFRFGRGPGLRLGGLASADDGLWVYNASTEDDVIKLHGANTDPWVDRSVLVKFGSPSGSVPYIGKFSHFAVTAKAAVAGTGDSWLESPGKWEITSRLLTLRVTNDRYRFEQEVGPGLGLAVSPQVSAGNTLDSDLSTTTTYSQVAGFPVPQRIRPDTYRPIVVDFRNVTQFALVTQATGSLGFSANASLTLHLWGVLWQADTTPPEVIENADMDVFIGAKRQ